MSTTTETLTPPAAQLLQLLVEKYQRVRDQGKICYQEADFIFEQIRESMNVGDRVTIEDGRVFEFVNNYDKSNVCFRPAGVRRLELVEVPKSRLSSPAP